MKIKRIEIESFGRLNDFMLDLDDGFQVLLGKNEEGKSTVMTFLKMMFYRKLGNVRSLEGNPRKKYLPWNGGQMGGAIEFESQGVWYRLQKTIGPVPSQDQITLLNLDRGTTVPLAREEELGRRFFLMDLSGFERSCFIGQTGAIGSVKNDELTTRLIQNLVQAGDETVSQGKVIERLLDAKEGLISKNGKKGLLAEAKLRLGELEEEREQVRLLLEEQQEAQEKFDILNHQRTIVKQKEKRRQLQKLEELIAEAERRETPGRAGTASGGLPEAVARTEEAAKLYTEAKAAYERVSNASEIDSDDPEAGRISEEDWRETAGKKAMLERCEFAVAQLEATVRPSASECDAHQREHAQLSAELEGLRQELQREIPGWTEEEQGENPEKQQLMDELEQLRSEYDSKQAGWEKRKRRVKEQVEAAQRQLEMLGMMESSGGPPVVLWAVILLTALFIGLMIWQRQPFFLVGLLLPAGLLIWQLLQMMGASEDKELLKRAQDKVDQALAAEDVVLNGISAESTQYTERIEEKKEQLLALLDSSGEDEENTLQKQYQDLSRRLGEVEIHRAAAEGVYDTYRKQSGGLCQEMALDPASLPEKPSLEAVDSLLAALGSKREELAAQLTDLLARKGCADFSAYQNRYEAGRVDQKNTAMVSGLKKDMEQFGRLLCEQVATWGKVSKPEDALLVLERMREELAATDRKQAELRIRAEEMGLGGLSLAELRKQRQEVQGMLQGYQVEELPVIPFGKDAACEVDDLEEQLLELQWKLRAPDRTMAEIEAEMETAQTKITEMETYYGAVCRALDTMQESADEMRNSFGPELNRKTGEILGSLTGQAYQSVQVFNDFEVQIKAGGYFREHGYFSSGTVDQVYLALRLAISQLISPSDDSLPLFLDDVFAQYDDERASMGLRFLAERESQPDRPQIVLFTCHQHIADKAKELYVPCRRLAGNQ